MYWSRMGYDEKDRADVAILVRKMKLRLVKKIRKDKEYVVMVAFLTKRKRKI